MPAAGQEHQVDLDTELPLDGLHLFDGAKLVVLSLDDQGRNLYLREIALEIPGAKARIEPGSIPAPKGTLDVLAVILRELSRCSLGQPAR